MRSGIGVLAVAATMAITMAWGGMALAGDKAPEQGTWEYRAALETGSLPGGYFGTDKAAQASAGHVSADKPALVEVGGIVYRIGIDTY